VQLWYLYNRHLLHVLADLPDTKLQGLCFIGEKEPITLETLIGQYLDHVSHHLDQIITPRETGPAA
jgi:hypothetical protein